MSPINMLTRRRDEPRGILSTCRGMDRKHSVTDSFHFERRAMPSDHYNKCHHAERKVQHHEDAAASSRLMKNGDAGDMPVATPWKQVKAEI